MMKRLAPGVYDDGRGGMHVDVSELLTANGWADTPANRAMFESTWREWAAKNHTPVHFTEDPIDADE